MNYTQPNYFDTIDKSATAIGEYGDSYSRFLDFAGRYRSDDEFRSLVDHADGPGVFAAFGFDDAAGDGIQVKVLANTDEVMYFVLPPDPNIDLSDDSLTQVTGGASCAGSAGCVGTASTLQCSTLPSSMSTLGTAGTAGSAS